MKREGRQGVCIHKIGWRLYDFEILKLMNLSTLHQILSKGAIFFQSQKSHLGWVWPYKYLYVCQWILMMNYDHMNISKYNLGEKIFSLFIGGTLRIFQEDFCGIFYRKIIRVPPMKSEKYFSPRLY